MKINTIKPVKISIPQIASWRTGEIITEEKLQQVFGLIGTAINNNAVSAEGLIRDLSEIAIPRRWIGECATYLGTTGIESFIARMDLLPAFLEAPTPTAGDCVYVKDNSDDPTLPTYLEAGKYMYVYIETVIDGLYVNGWKLYMRVFDPENDPIKNSIYTQNANKILDPMTGLYNLLTETSIHLLKGLTEEEIYDLLRRAITLFSMTETYPLGARSFIVNGESIIFDIVSKIDNNLGNQPETSPDSWFISAEVPVDLDYIISLLIPLIPPQVKAEVAKQLAEEELTKSIASMSSVKEFLTPTERTDYIARAIAIDPTLTEDDFAEIDEDGNYLSLTTTSVQKVVSPVEFENTVHFIGTKTRPSQAIEWLDFDGSSFAVVGNRNGALDIWVKKDMQINSNGTLTINAGSDVIGMEDNFVANVRAGRRGTKDAPNMEQLELKQDKLTWVVGTITLTTDSKGVVILPLTKVFLGLVPSGNSLNYITFFITKRQEIAVKYDNGTPYVNNNVTISYLESVAAVVLAETKPEEKISWRKKMKGKRNDKI